MHETTGAQNSNFAPNSPKMGDFPHRKEIFRQGKIFWHAKETFYPSCHDDTDDDEMMKSMFARSYSYKYSHEHANDMLCVNSSVFSSWRTVKLAVA